MIGFQSSRCPVARKQLRGFLRRCRSVSVVPRCRLPPARHCSARYRWPRPRRSARSPTTSASSRSRRARRSRSAAMWVLSGADTALGLDEQRGVEIALQGPWAARCRPSAEAQRRGRHLQRRGRPDRGDQARRQPANRRGARPGLLLRPRPGGADPVAAGHHRHLHRLHGARADRAGPQARVRRLRAHRLQRQRAGQGGCHLRAQCAEGEDRRHHP